jgi:hypothetical protein
MLHCKGGLGSIEACKILQIDAFCHVLGTSMVLKE